MPPAQLLSIFFILAVIFYERVSVAETGLGLVILLPGPLEQLGLQAGPALQNIL